MFLLGRITVKNAAKYNYTWPMSYPERSDPVRRQFATPHNLTLRKGENFIAINRQDRIWCSKVLVVKITFYPIKSNFTTYQIRLLSFECSGPLPNLWLKAKFLTTFWTSCVIQPVLTNTITLHSAQSGFMLMEWVMRQQNISVLLYLLRGQHSFLIFWRLFFH